MLGYPYRTLAGIAPPWRSTIFKTRRRKLVNPLPNLLNPCATRVLRVLALLAGLSAANLAHAQTRFSYSSDDSEVSDAKTGLVWQRCSRGQTWRGSTCDGAAVLFTHELALVEAQSQAGWRLPNVKELSSLTDRSRVNPSIDITAFPNTPSSIFWSSSPFVGSASAAWAVYFNHGNVSSYARHYGWHVRLVR